jgi:hypothetical protein
LGFCSSFRIGSKVFCSHAEETYCYLLFVPSISKEA